MWVLLEMRGQVHTEQADKERRGRHAERHDTRAEVKREEPVAVAVEDQLDDLLCIVDVRTDLVNLRNDFFHLLLETLEQQLEILQIALLRLEDALLGIGQIHERHVLVILEHFCHGHFDTARSTEKAVQFARDLQQHAQFLSVNVVFQRLKQVVHHDPQPAELRAQRIQHRRKDRFQRTELVRQRRRILPQIVLQIVHKGGVKPRIARMIALKQQHRIRLDHRADVQNIHQDARPARQDRRHQIRHA